MVGRPTCGRLLLARLPATVGLGRIVHREPQLRRQRFVIGIWEGVVGDGAFGGGHEIAANVCFGRALGKRRKEKAPQGANRSSESQMMALKSRGD